MSYYKEEIQLELLLKIERDKMIKLGKENAELKDLIKDAKWLLGFSDLDWKELKIWIEKANKWEREE